MVPSINREWHPFTLASAPHEPQLSFYIKALGDWTKSLHAAFQARLSDPSTNSPLSVRVRGPFGAPCQQVDGYSRLVLVAGGIGATPFASVCKQLWQARCASPSCPASTKRAPPHSIARERAIDGRVDAAVRAAFGTHVDAGAKGSPASQGGGGEGERERAPRGEDDWARGNQMAEVVRALSGSGEKGVVRADVSDSEDYSGSPIRSSSDSSSSSSGASDTPGATVVGLPFPSANATQGVVPEVGGTSYALSAAMPPQLAGALVFFHSARVVFVLCVASVMRICVVVAGAIFDADFVGIGSAAEDQTSDKWVLFAHLAVSLPLLAVLPFTAIGELLALRSQAFASIRRVMELAAFLPLLALSVAADATWAARGRGGGPIATFLQYVVFEVVLLCVLIVRLWYSVERRSALASREVRKGVKAAMAGNRGNGNGADGACCSMGVDVDFVWTAPKHDGDGWLRRELEGVADEKGAELRMHRYLTRAKAGDIGEAGDVESGGGPTFEEVTRFGRPEWRALLAEVARGVDERDGTVGVFFCGPEKMAKEVMAAAREVEMWSNLRDAWLRGEGDAVLQKRFGLKAKGEVNKVRERGCRVKFVFRKENF